MSKPSFRIVLTGGPSSGKSTTIDALRTRGFRVLDEVAREVLSEGRYSRTNGYDKLQAEILKRQLEREQLLTDLTFMDRSAVDGIAYCLLYLNSLPQVFREVDFKGRYNRVFLLDRLPLEKDGLRVEADDAEAQMVHDKIRDVYLMTGYEPVQVPIMSVRDRVDFIINNAGFKLN